MKLEEMTLRELAEYAWNTYMIDFMKFDVTDKELDEPPSPECIAELLTLVDELSSLSDS